LIESIATLIKDSWWLWAIATGTLVFLVGYAIGFRQIRFADREGVNPVGCTVALVLLAVACALLTNGLYYVETHDLNTLAVAMPTHPPLPPVTPEPGKPFSGIQMQPIITLDQMFAGFINVCAFILSLFYPKSLCVILLIVFIIFAASIPDRRP